MLSNTLKSLFFLSIIWISIPLSADLSNISDSQKSLLDSLPPDQRSGILEKMNTLEETQAELDEVFEKDNSLIERPAITQNEECLECIFGYDFFRYSPSTFVPIDNSPVPSAYILGPGDKIKIDIFGGDFSSFETYISREGNILIPKSGEVNLIGTTYSDAVNLIKNKISRSIIGADASISLSELRSINIYVLGEAYQPGQYTMSGLTNISNALFVSGGVNKQGSLRNIQIKRNDKLIATYDFYDFLLRGSTSSDLKLQDGDIVFIPFIENKVELKGSFKRPHLYEFIKGETVGDAIELAGGFKSDVLSESKLELSYIDKELFERKYREISKEDFGKELEDGYALNVTSKSGINSETIKLSGEIKNPGVYSIRPGDTILDILNRAGGMTVDAYVEGAVFLRESVAESQKNAFLRSAVELENTIIDIITKGSIDNITEFTLSPITILIKRLREEEPPGRMVVDLDSLNLKTNPILNFQVRHNDSIYIPKRPNSISIVGEVLYSSTLSFDPSKDVNEFINLSGGLKNSADKDKIFVILPDGKSQLIRKSLFPSKNILLPGSTIVVSRDPRPFDAVNLTQIITPILADLATSAAAIAAISD